MSLPNYLSNIKSSGIYRFTWDKSIVPPVEAPTLRLVVGYSEKGPFNTPVYIDNVADFTEIFGRVSKRLERKGVFFHRMALQALTAGPILALNLKPFTASSAHEEAIVSNTGKEGGKPTTLLADAVTGEQVKFAKFDPSELVLTALKPAPMDVKTLYDTNRFWKLDADVLPAKANNTDKYVTITSTDVIDNSCTVFFRKIKPASYDITIESWYNSVAKEEIPDYLLKDPKTKSTKLNDYFMEIYVFRGNIDETAMASDALEKYFTSNAIKSTFENAFGEKADALKALAEDENSGFIASYSGIVLPYFKDGNGNYISLDLKFNADNYKHNMLMKFNEAIFDKPEFTIANIKPSDTILDTKFPALQPTYFAGYTYTTIAKGATAKAIQDAALKVLTDEKGIRTALTNNMDVQYHYLIDTFASLATDSAACKSKLSAIAKAKDNCLAILNFPAMSEFINTGTYVDEKGRFDITKVKDNFHLPIENEGASYCAFYTPIVLSDGTVKTTCPSAAIVSNNYMEKYASRQPYYIVAGSNYGRLSAAGLVGPDYNFGRSDLDVLEPMGVNAIVYVPRKGTFINSNQTAKQTPVTALSKINVRELVIYLQDEIESMLQNYQWELNTQTLRGTVKAKADTILENVKNNGGVYAYVNVCDETNNTPEVIDNEMIILDTAIEPARGAGKMVQQITIHKTGALSSMTK